MNNNNKVSKTICFVLAGSLMAATPMQTYGGIFSFFKKKTPEKLTGAIGRFFNSASGVKAIAFSLLIGGTIASFYNKDRNITQGKKTHIPFYFNNTGEMLLSLSEGSIFFLFSLGQLILGKRLSNKIGTYIEDKVNGLLPDCGCDDDDDD